MAGDPSITRAGVYRTIWRWHFYAGLFVLPFVILLSISGSLYLFKPQIERWEERAFINVAVEASATPQQQVEAALGAHQGGRFLDFRLPEFSGGAAMIRLAMAEGQAVREVFVAPDGKVLGSLVPEERIMAVVKRIHSELLAGTLGNRLVELAANWAIVLLLSGLYLWWPRGRGAAGTLWPRLTLGKRLFWRDLHAVTGLWISGFALVLLLTGLPWTGVWGSAFQALRTEMGWVKGTSTWDIEGGAAQAVAAAHEHDGDVGHHAGGAEAFSGAALDAMVARAGTEHLAFPAIVTAPGAPGRFGQPGEMVWTIRSDVQNTPLQQTIRFDLDGQRELSRERFQDRHIVDRVVGYGIAWHEGQLFGWLNQLAGVLTAVGLVTLAGSGFVLWRRRKPAGVLGAPPAETMPAAMAGAAGILLLLALLLPLLAISLVLVWLTERFVLSRVPRLADWLGLPPPTAA